MDTCSLEPGVEGGQVVVTFSGKPYFRGELTPDGIKLQEGAGFVDVDRSRDEEFPSAEGAILEGQPPEEFPSEETEEGEPLQESVEASGAAEEPIGEFDEEEFEDFDDEEFAEFEDEDFEDEDFDDEL